MWEWLNGNAKELVGIVKIDPFIGDRDDIVQETMMYLLDNQELAQKIYATKSRSLLFSIMKKVIFRENAKASGLKRDALTHLNRVKEVCEQYGIEKTAENAYKISGVLDDPKFSIVYVVSLLNNEVERPVRYYGEQLRSYTEGAYEEVR